METRNVKISLQTAKEWYNGFDSSLRELALQAFKEEELVEFTMKRFPNNAKIDLIAGYEDNKVIRITSRRLDSVDKVIYLNPKVFLNPDRKKYYWSEECYLFELLSVGLRNASDELYYHGEEATRRALYEAKQLRMDVPAFEAASKYKLSVNGHICKGYIPAAGEFEEVYAIREALDDLLFNIYGKEKLCSNLLSNDLIWTSTQHSIFNAYSFSSSMVTDPKNSGKLVVPFFAAI